jgi:hypothetical protein
MSAAKKALTIEAIETARGANLRIWAVSLGPSWVDSPRGRTPILSVMTEKPALSWQHD